LTRVKPPLTFERTRPVVVARLDARTARLSHRLARPPVHADYGSGRRRVKCAEPHPPVPGRRRMRPLSLRELESSLAALPLPIAREPIRWPDTSLHFAAVREKIEPALPLILEKYLPQRRKAATVHPVTDGRSGTPLIRLSVDDDRQQYFFKFFETSQEFGREWKAHKRAAQWLPGWVVPMRAVPEDPKSQLEVFQTPSAKFFPICYESARATTTLKDLYEKRDPGYVRAAYGETLKTLAHNQRPLEGRPRLVHRE